MSDLTKSELFQITKYELNGCIQNLENGINQAKAALDNAETLEQLEQAKMLLELSFSSTIHEMNRLIVQNLEKTK